MNRFLMAVAVVVIVGPGGCKERDPAPPPAPTVEPSHETGTLPPAPINAAVRRQP